MGAVLFDAINDLAAAPWDISYAPTKLQAARNGWPNGV